MLINSGLAWRQVSDLDFDNATSSALHATVVRGLVSPATHNVGITGGNHSQSLPRQLCIQPQL